MSYTPTLPPGYAYQQDPAGFTFPLPTGSAPWVRSADGTVAITYSPDNGTHKVIFGVTPGQGYSPMQHAQNMQQMVAVKDHTYQEVSMLSDLFHGYLGTRWEYTYVAQGGGGPHHAIEQLYKDATGTEYDILVDYPAPDWNTGFQRFLDITGGFSAP